MSAQKRRRGSPAAAPSRNVDAEHDAPNLADLAAADQAGLIAIIAPRGEPDLTLARLLATPTVASLIMVASDEVVRAAADDALLWLEAGAYVIAKFARAADRPAFEAMLARATGRLQ